MNAECWVSMHAQTQVWPLPLQVTLPRTLAPPVTIVMDCPGVMDRKGRGQRNAPPSPTDLPPGQAARASASPAPQGTSAIPQVRGHEHYGDI